MSENAELQNSYRGNKKYLMTVAMFFTVITLCEVVAVACAVYCGLDVQT